MRKSLKVIGIVLSAVAAVVFLLGALWFWYSRRAFPKTGGVIHVEGLAAPVEVLRDSNGVPHIYADSIEDLFFAQGFVHAQDRFWQMEFWRRLGAGRIAELFGEKQKKVDVFMRTMGFTRIAQQEYEQMDDESKSCLEAYAAGVNAYILDRKPVKLALEFALLKLTGVKIEIEPWSPVHSLTWAKVMSYDLGANMYEERLTLELIRTAGLRAMADFFSPYREDMPLIVPDDELGPFSGSQIASFPAAGVEELFRGFPPRKPPARTAGLAPNATAPLVLSGTTGLGSNSWVVSGRLTATGKPLLANDQHLDSQMPSIWYEIGLHCPANKDGSRSENGDSLNVRGFSFAVVPGVIVGHNDCIAWGFTNVGGDVQDFYLERINPENPHQYEVDGQWVDMEITHEKIEIHKEDEPYVLLVKKTRHGPLLSDSEAFTSLGSYRLFPEAVFPLNLELYGVSLSWPALRPGEIFKAILRLNRARNFEDFREALSHWNAPAQNVIYADVDGNIGYQTAGLIPVRRKGFGIAPAPGWTDDYEWLGFIPFEELPSVYNPEKGYIVTANNPIASRNYPYLLGTEFAYGFRARRITDMIEQDSNGISIDDIITMQSDTLNLTALEIIPYLKGLAFKPPEYEETDRKESEVERKKREKEEREEIEALESARDSLLEWDGRMERDSSQAAIYSFFWVALVEETFKYQYPENRWPPTDQNRLRNTFYYLFQDPENLLWDDLRTPEVSETRDEILVRAFRKGYREGREKLGKKLASWKWGKIHSIEFRNQTLGKSGIALIERIFNRGPYPLQGDSSVVNAAAWNVEEPFEVDFIASMRAIIDLNDLGTSLMVHTPGQSGHPGHRHYADLIEPWKNVRYHSNRWERGEVEKDSRKRLILKPLR